MPTSKNTGMATRKPTAVSATATRLAPSFSVKWLASDCTPPDTSIMRPNTAPRAISNATLPMVPPTPLATTVNTSAKGICAATATRMLTASNATKAWILKRMIMSNSSATPATAMVSSSGVPRATDGLMAGASAARTAKELMRGIIRGVSFDRAGLDSRPARGATTAEGGPSSSHVSLGCFARQCAWWARRL